MLNHPLSIKCRIYRWLEMYAPESVATKWVNGGLFALIILNAMLLIVESVPQMYGYHRWMAAVEMFSMWVFTLEYMARIWSCNEHPRYAGMLLGRIRYACTPMLLIDLLAILPFWLQMAGINVAMLRMLRLFRFLKLWRLVRFSCAYGFIAGAVSSKRDEFMVALLLMLLTLLVASSLMYFAEHEAQPEIFSSIPATFWWGVVTFSSVGYGDAYPVTIMGKIIGGLFSVIGICVFALPASIFTAAMLDQMRQARSKTVSDHEEW